MAGFDLKQGEYKDIRLSDDEMWSAFAYLFSSKSVNDTSYKFGFLKSILDNLYNVDENLVLNFDQLFSTFAEIYWNLVLKYHIRQKKPDKTGRRSSLENILYDAEQRFHIELGIPFESITDEMKIYVCHNVKVKCKQNVVGALYEDLGELFYSFSKAGEWIQFNPQMYTFVCKNKTAIEKINYYEWATFLEKVNNDDAMNHLLTKIDDSTHHSRNSLAYFRDILFQEFERKCFYCGKPVEIGKVEVDHFIPWSFIKDDKLWNFVLACPDCNGKKSNKLADGAFLDKIESRNNILIQTHGDIGMTEYNRIRLIYNWAQKNGYSDIWKPKREIG